MRLDLNEADLDLLGRALGQLPYAQVVGLINKLQSQITAQQQPSAAQAPERAAESEKGLDPVQPLQAEPVTC